MPIIQASHPVFSPILTECKGRQEAEYANGIKIGNLISVSALTCEEFSCSERENSIELTVPVNNRQNADTIFKIEFDKPISEIYKKTESSLFENDFSDRAINLGEL